MTIEKRRLHLNLLKRAKIRLVVFLGDAFIIICRVGRLLLVYFLDAKLCSAYIISVHRSVGRSSKM